MPDREVHRHNRRGRLRIAAGRASSAGVCAGAVRAAVLDLRYICVPGSRQQVAGFCVHRHRSIAHIHPLRATVRNYFADRSPAMHARLPARLLISRLPRREMRTRIDGPTAVLKPNVAQAIAVALHELATNAAKYGALSVAKGHVRVGRARQMTRSCSAGLRREVRPSIHRRAEVVALVESTRRGTAGHCIGNRVRGAVL
jgi:hypothetical protein